LIGNNDQTLSNENGAGTSQSNTPQARKKKGKPKWLPLPLDEQLVNDENDPSVSSNINAQSGANRSMSTKLNTGINLTSKGSRGGKSSRGGRGSSRNRARSLDGASTKRTRKSRTPAATGTTTGTAGAYQHGYDAYQDYYSYYCM
jgi:hypothetical protein